MGAFFIKENKTYDQAFGDMAQGNSDPSLCIYPRFVTPNHHTLAQQYVLLDNFYCSGVKSAAGHSTAPMDHCLPSHRLTGVLVRPTAAAPVT